MDLFPEIEPFDTRKLPVDGIHTLHVEQAGNPAGLPVLFLHGGPGSGCLPEHRRLFDPVRFRAILVDQRGAGRSTPLRCLEANTTDHLVADLETLRAALGIDRWMVVGGSWGSTLALAYAQRQRPRILAMVLRSVFLGTESEVDWAFHRGPRTFAPELWRAFVDLLPQAERAHPIDAYGKRLMDADPKIHVPAARIWNDFERALSWLVPPSRALPPTMEAAFAATAPPPNSPYVEWHYFSRRCFLAPGQLLDGMQALAGLPGIVVHGRYDLLCPPAAAYAVTERWPDAQLRIVEPAGHTAAEPAMRLALLGAIDEMGRRLI